MRYMSAAAIVVGFAATAVLAASGAPAAHLSAAQIIEKNVAARGGLDAWHRVQSMEWLGRIESVHASVPGMRFVLTQQRPNKTRFEINAMGDRTLRVFDGTQGWKLRPSHGRPVVEPYTIQELRFAQDGPGIDGLLIGYADKPGSVEVKGIDEIDKRAAYHLILHAASGDRQHVWVDAKTFLEVRYDRPTPGQGGASRTVSVVYRDYKDTEGLKIPSIIETGAGAGMTPDRMVIEKVVLNPQLDAKTFSVPGGPARQARQPTGVPFARHRPTVPGAGLPPPSRNPPPPGSSPGAASPPPKPDSGSSPR